MTEPIDEARAEEIREVLEPHVRQGEAFLARRDGGRVLVDSVTEVPSLGGRQPDLYGQLLSTNQQIVDASSWAFFAVSIFFVVVSGIVLLDLVDWVFGVPIEKLQSIWFYAGLALACFLIFAQWVLWVQRSAYKRGRDDIEDAITKSGMSREAVIAAIQGDKAVNDVAERMKGDTDVNRRRR